MYTVRKSGGIVGSFFAALLGLGFIAIGSPLAAWYAESQHQAKDFSTASQVTSDVLETGYVAVTGTAESTDPLACPSKDSVSNADCIWVQTEQQTYQREEKRQCGSLTNNQTIVSNLPDECDSNGSNCERCYQVAETKWETVDTTDDFAPFSVGVYTVTPTDTVNFIGEDSFTTATASVPVVGDQRQVMTYYPLKSVVLVAGLSTDGKVGATTDGKPFVISNVDYAGTLTELKAQDSAITWILRIVSLILMVLGMIMIASPLTYFTNIFRIIPFLGNRVDQGFDAVIGFVAALLGVGMWSILWMLVLFLKNIWLILGVLVVLAVIVIVLIMHGKKKQTTTAAPTTSPTESPQS